MAVLRIGIDLGGTKIAGIALDASGRVLAERRIATPRGEYDASLRAIAALVGFLEAESGGTGTVGVGIPGALVPETGRVKNANSTWLNGRPLGDDLSRVLARPVRLENDANCLAVSEAVDGRGRGRRRLGGDPRHRRGLGHRARGPGPVRAPAHRRGMGP